MSLCLECVSRGCLCKGSGSSRPHWKAVCASLISLFSLKGPSRLAAVTTRTASPTQCQQPHDGTTRPGKTHSNPHTHIHTMSLLAHSVYSRSHLHTWELLVALASTHLGKMNGVNHMVIYNSLSLLKSSSYTSTQKHTFLEPVAEFDLFVLCMDFSQGWCHF